MNSKRIDVDAFEVPASPGLDSFLIILRNTGPGAGRLLLECAGEAYSASWGAMGRSLRRFLAECPDDYLFRALRPVSMTTAKVPAKLIDARLTRLVKATQAALRAQLAADHIPHEPTDTDLLTWFEDNAHKAEISSWPIADSGDYDSAWTIHGDTLKAPGAVVEIGHGTTLRRAIQDAMLEDDDPQKSTYASPEELNPAKS